MGPPRVSKLPTEVRGPGFRRAAIRLKTSVTRDDGTLVLDGDAVCYTMPIAKGANG
jgi:hypothetical protein